jgi:hypothetical protein
VHQVQIGMAEAGAGDPHENLTWTRFRCRDVGELGRLLPGGEPNRLHASTITYELKSRQFVCYHDAGMSAQPPLWLKLVLRVERAVGGPVEWAVRSDAYFDAVAELNRTKRRLTDAAEALSKRGLHLLNLPAGTDIRRVREQLARMDRRLVQLTKELEELERVRETERE